MPLRTIEQQIRIRHNEEPGFFPLSYSRIDGYKRCKLRYKYENIDKLGRVSGEHADLGSAAHTFQEVLLTDGIEKAADMARAMVPLGKSKAWLNAKAIIESIEYKKDHLYLSERSLHWEWPATKLMPDAQSSRAEQIGVSSSEVYTIQLEAKIDLLFVNTEAKSIEIIDGKSGRQVDTKLDENVQGKIYAITVLENLGDLDIERILFTQAQWHFGRLVTVEYSREELVEYKAQIEAIGRQMLNESEYKPTPGNHCHWCPFVMRCDAAQKILPPLVEIAGEKLPSVITSDEEAAAIGQGVIHLEEIVKRYKEAIRGYVKETKRPIKIGEGGWDWFRRSTLKVEDLDVLIKLASEKKINISAFLSFNNRTGKTLVKHHPEFLEGLVEDQYPFFDFKAKLNEDDDDS